MGDLTLGSKLRAAREIKGVDISTAAEKTKILPQIVREIEEDDFHRVPAPIYAKGFIRSYCEYLNIDPQPLIEEYMEKHNQKQDLRSVTEEKVASKAKLKIPDLSGMLPKMDLKNSKISPAVLAKAGIAVGVMIVLAVLISVIGKCDGKKAAPESSDQAEIEQIISEPQDVYLIKPGEVETK